MFLKKINGLTKQVGFKMTLWHLALLFISFLLLFSVFYFLYSQTLKEKDHEILEGKFQEYISLYNKGGIKELENHLNSNLVLKDNSLFFVRIMNAETKEIYFRTSRNTHSFDQNEVKIKLAEMPDNQKWYYIKTANLEHDVEILSKKLENKYLFQIGKTIEDREVLLKQFKTIFAEVAIFALIIGGISGLLLANRLLVPLRGLVATLNTIKSGNDEARVPQIKSNDELEELNQLFNSMLDRIQNTNLAMRQTLDTVAHELRTPLTSIRGIAEITLRKENISSEEYRKVLEDAIEGIDEILSEFKMMTDITEVESGLQNLQKETIDLQQVCNDIVDLYEIVAEQKEINISLESNDPLFIFADRKKLRQAIGNLVDNAIKYSPPGTTITLHLNKLSKNAFIKISDQGVGISE
jgi:signal transduction histidine kinase